jgi:tetratricopeptide (TPR) repeat protein
MIRRSFGILLLVSTCVGWMPTRARAQAPAAVTPRPLSMTQLGATPERIWTVFGHITTPDGKPAVDAKVRVDIGLAAFPPRALATNIQGNFTTQYTLEAKPNQTLSVEVVATKAGYFEGRAAAEFKDEEGTREFRLVLRKETEDPDLLSLPSLVASLAPRLRAPGAGGPVSASAQKDYQYGAEQFLDKHSAVNAIPSLAKAVEREPNCIECHALLSLAELETGAWDSATRQLLAATDMQVSERASAKRPEPLLILGVLETWRREPQAASAYFLKALELQPADSLVLQELGRALILQQNWEAADQYLAKAIEAGASGDARVLRVQALLELSDTAEAEREMKHVLEGRQPRDMPAPVRRLYAQLQERLQLKAYGSAKSVVSQPLSDLVRAMPELADLQPAADQAELPRLLQRVGEGVEAFFLHLPNTSSHEDIREEILRRDGKVQDSIEEQFLYLLVMRAEQLDLQLSEYRTGVEQLGAQATGIKLGFMRTTGFACTSLHFHPMYQSGAAFRLLGRQKLDGRETFVIGFAQRPEAAQRIGRFDVDGKSVPVLVQGLVWVDGEKYQILRMRTDLLKPPPNSRLERQTTDIQYGEVQFKEVPTPFWLPREVTVTVQWKGRTFRNLHRYSDFRVFKVQTEEKRRAAGSPPKADRTAN